METKASRPKPTTIRGVLWSRLRDKAVDVAPRALRVAAVLAVAWIVALLVTGHRAKADIHEVMLGFGAQMMRFDQADHQGAPRELWINGQKMMMATATTRHSLRTVMDYYERRCMQRDGDFAGEVARVAEARHLTAPLPDRRAIDSTMRFDNEHRGFVACLDMGENRVPLEELSSKLRDFADTGDLSTVGNLRYVYATNEQDRTHIVTFWTDDHFMIGHMFPSTGDAPGRDPAHIPRPEGGRRLLSSWEEGQPESLTLYAQVPQTPQQLETFYRREMPRNGWTLLQATEARTRLAHEHSAELRQAATGDARVIGAERERDLVFLVLDEGQDGKGVVTMVTSR